jgi:hypothetical protein
LRRSGSIGMAGDVGLMSASSNVFKNASIFVRCAFTIDQRFQLAMRWARVGGKTLYNGVEPSLWGGVKKGDAGGAYAPKCLQGDDVCAVLIRSERLRGMVLQSPAVSLCPYTATEKTSDIFLHAHYPTSSLGSNSSSLTKVHRIRTQIHPEEQSPIDAIGLAI